MTGRTPAAGRYLPYGGGAKHHKPTLEDYILDMETRPPEAMIGANPASASGVTVSNVTDQNLWEQLQKKEEDLLLAAELGKALLDKNEELTKQHERMVEDYSTKLERLEQEKHVLRRKLSAAESESDIRAQELESDFNELQKKMMAQESTIRQNEREKNLLIEELTAQNVRLSSQLQMCSQTETALTTKLQDVQDQYCLQNSSLQNHAIGVESLRDELDMLAKNKEELERRLQTSLVEKDTLCASLDEAFEKIHVLQRQLREQEMKLQATLHQMDRLKRENDTLSERLESCSPPNGHSSLHNEMDCDDEFAEDRLDVTEQLVKEARSVYNQLKQLHGSLNSNQDVDSGLHSDLFLGGSEPPSPNGGSGIIQRSGGAAGAGAGELRQGMLSAVTDDIVNLVMGLDVVQLKTLLEQSRAACMEQDDELRRRTDMILDLECKVSVKEIELQSALEERNRARQDASESNLAQDEIVSAARADRDAATARRTKAEIDLARTRVELMQANSELLEAVQQKVELSQQLEQWQMDMHELIEEQMKKQLSENMPVRSRSTGTAVTSTPMTKRAASRFMGLFQR